MAKQINFGGSLIKQFGAYIRTSLDNLVDINGVASGIIGIVGLSERGPVNKAVVIDSYTQLVETFGDGPLVRHGLAAYVGGANRLICVRTGSPSGASLTTILVDDTPTDLDYTWSAVELGTDGNGISLGVDVSDANYTIRIKYIDPYGNDLRETFVTPRYVPDPTYTDSEGNPAYRFYADNVNDKHYYVLRDRETGVIREVPHTWGYGNDEVDDFLEKVEENRASTEDLLGPFPADAGTNPYPLALIKSIINFGGMGMAPSSLVRLLNEDPGISELLTPGYTYDPNNADVLVSHPFVSLSGGNNGDDGTNYYGIVNDIDGSVDYNMTFDVGASTIMEDSWVASLAIMEDEEVNFIQPAYLFNYETGSDTLEWTRRYGFYKSLMPIFIAHINSMSNVVNRRFRTMITGLPYYKKGTTANKTEADFLDATQEISGLINSDRIQLWAGGFRSRAFSSKLEDYGGDMLASFVVGAQAAREVSVSLTFAQLSGIFTDGLEFAFNQAQKDELYTRSQAFVMKRRNSTGAIEFVAAHNYTSFTGASSRGLQLFITRRIVDYMNTFVYKNLEENFIGRKSRGEETAARLAEFTAALLQRLIREDVLVAVANVAARADDEDKTVYHITYDFQPITEIDFITVTNSLVYTIA